MFFCDVFQIFFVFLHIESIFEMDNTDKQYTLKAPERLCAKVDLPSSKSISNRALIISALAGGGVIPDNLSDCDDTEVVVAALKEMPDVIDIKAAGTAMRFMTAYLSTLEGGDHVIMGTERMKHRPIKVLVDALRFLGADIEYVENEGFPPLRIRGRKLDGGELDIPGDVSSQYISALLMVGPLMKNGLTLNLQGDVISRPYIDLTLWMMNEWGAKVEWTDRRTIVVEPKPYVPRNYMIENDWSSASYWYEMMALSQGIDDEIVLTGLMDGSKQGDSSLRYVFSLLGVKTVFSKQGLMADVTLKRVKTVVSHLEYDFINAPDLAQTFVACCCAMNVKFRFKGLQTLKIKETDRIEALKTEMRKLGYVLHDVDDCELYWDGERCEPAEDRSIDTYEDHRMALAFAPLALRLGEMRINDPHVVSKSYPHFWNDLRATGWTITSVPC